MIGTWESVFHFNLNLNYALDTSCELSINYIVVYLNVYILNLFSQVA